MDDDEQDQEGAAPPPLPTRPRGRHRVPEAERRRDTDMAPVDEAKLAAILAHLNNWERN